MKIPRIRLKADEFAIVEQYRAIKNQANGLELKTKQIA